MSEGRLEAWPPPEDRAAVQVTGTRSAESAMLMTLAIVTLREAAACSSEQPARSVRALRTAPLLSRIHRLIIAALEAFFGSSKSRSQAFSVDSRARRETSSVQRAQGLTPRKRSPHPCLPHQIAARASAPCRGARCAAPLAGQPACARGRRARSRRQAAQMGGATPAVMHGALADLPGAGPRAHHPNSAALEPESG